MTTRSRLFLARCLAGLAAPALAQDGGLYADVPDPNASFVRIVAADLTNAVVDTKTFDQLDSGISGYVVVGQPGPIKVVTGMDEATVTVESGKYHTIIVGADGTAKLVAEDRARWCPRILTAPNGFAPRPPRSVTAPGCCAMRCSCNRAPKSTRPPLPPTARFWPNSPRVIRPPAGF